MTADLFGTLLSAVLTVMVLSYLWRDNALFRAATFVFVGVAGGYAGSIAWHNVLVPNLVTPFVDRGLLAVTDVSLMIPTLLVFALLFKLSPATTKLGSVSTALMVGVGAGVIVGGGITGTLIPQALAAMNSLNPRAVMPLTGETGGERVINVMIMLTGTLTTLMYFQFSARRTVTGETGIGTFQTVVAYTGRVFIAVTFGAMYAGVLMTTVIALADRLQLFTDLATRLLPG